MSAHKSSLKRSSSLYTSAKTQDVAQKKSNVLGEIENKPSNLLRNKFKPNEVEEKRLDLSLSDCTCPICLEVLIEPVRMPCTHELCLPCFKAMTDQTNFLCPMCRMRISTWSRNASNSNSLVNVERWEQIKKAFPLEIQNRIEGKTAVLLAQKLKKMKSGSSSNPSSPQKDLHHCSQPGEIRKEYQEYLKREEERIRTEKENEEKLSLNLIQELIQKEEHLSFNDYLNALNRTNQTVATTSSASASSATASNIFARAIPNQTPTTSNSLTSKSNLHSNRVDILPSRVEMLKKNFTNSSQTPILNKLPPTGHMSNTKATATVNPSTSSGSATASASSSSNATNSLNEKPAPNPVIIKSKPVETTEPTSAKNISHIITRLNSGQPVTPTIQPTNSEAVTSAASTSKLISRPSLRARNRSYAVSNGEEANNSNNSAASNLNENVDSKRPKTNLNELPIAQSLKLNPRSSVKKSREEANLIAEKLKNRNKSKTKNDSIIITYSSHPSLINDDEPNNEDQATPEATSNKKSTLKRKITKISKSKNSINNEKTLNLDNSDNLNNETATTHDITSNDESTSANTSIVSGVSTRSTASTTRSKRNKILN